MKFYSIKQPHTNFKERGFCIKSRRFAWYTIKLDENDTAISVKNHFLNVDVECAKDYWLHIGIMFKTKVIGFSIGNSEPFNLHDEINS